MHELTLCRSVLAEVERVATAHRASRVTRILLAVGPLSGVEPVLLERAFAVARAGTAAEAATLEIEAAPIRVRCMNCGAEREAAVNRLSCEACGDWRVRILCGDELLLKRIELSAAPEEERDEKADAERGMAAISV